MGRSKENKRTTLPFFERSSSPVASSLDTTVKTVVLVEMAPPVLWEANFSHRHSVKSQSIPKISFHELDH